MVLKGAVRFLPSNCGPPPPPHLSSLPLPSSPPQALSSLSSLLPLSAVRLSVSSMWCEV
jgi:hypothetical protein